MTNRKGYPVIALSTLLAIGCVAVALFVPARSERASATDPTVPPTHTLDPAVTEEVGSFPTQVPLGRKKPLWPTNVPYHTSTLPSVSGTAIPLQPTP